MYSRHLKFSFCRFLSSLSHHALILSTLDQPTSPNKQHLVSISKQLKSLIGNAELIKRLARMIGTDTLAGLREPEKSVSCDNQHTANQGLSITDSLLPPSEPPEIKNWFSSYEYESLVLETDDNFVFSEHKEYGNECSSRDTVKKTESSRELVTSGKTDGMIKKKKSSVLIECNQSVKADMCQNHVLASPDLPLLSPVESEPPGIENWFSSYAYESPTTNTMDDLFLSDHKESMVVHNDKEVKKDENLSHVPSDDSNCNQTLEQCDKGSAEDVKNPTELPNESANLNSSENVNQISSEANSLEAKGDENGFVSIKSKRRQEEDTKSMCGNQKRVPSCAGKMKKDGDESARRKILGDVTNIDERSGKWKCPRKRTPDVGPPLKQLRLGQWFHHV